MLKKIIHKFGLLGYSALFIIPAIVFKILSNQMREKAALKCEEIIADCNRFVHETGGFCTPRCPPPEIAGFAISYPLLTYLGLSLIGIFFKKTRWVSCCIIWFMGAFVLIDLGRHNHFLGPVSSIFVLFLISIGICFMRYKCDLKTNTSFKRDLGFFLITVLALIGYRCLL